MRACLKFRFLVCLAVIGGVGVVMAQPTGTKTLSESALRNMGRVPLPPLEDRKILGTWFDPDCKCTYSLEKVKDQYFLVDRYPNKQEGMIGKKIIMHSETRFRPIEPTGIQDYTILKDGRLGQRWNGGDYQVLSKHAQLWP